MKIYAGLIWLALLCWGCKSPKPGMAIAECTFDRKGNYFETSLVFSRSPDFLPADTLFYCSLGFHAREFFIGKANIQYPDSVEIIKRSYCEGMIVADFSIRPAMQIDQQDSSFSASGMLSVNLLSASSKILREVAKTSVGIDTIKQSDELDTLELFSYNQVRKNGNNIPLQFVVDFVYNDNKIRNVNLRSLVPMQGITEKNEVYLGRMHDIGEPGGNIYLRLVCPGVTNK